MFVPFCCLSTAECDRLCDRCLRSGSKSREGVNISSYAVLSVPQNLSAFEVAGVVLTPRSKAGPSVGKLMAKGTVGPLASIATVPAGTFVYDPEALPTVSTVSEFDRCVEAGWRRRAQRGANPLSLLM